MNRAISTAISERVIPEIQNIVSSMSSSGNRDTEASMSPSSQEKRENSSGLRSETMKKVSRSVGDLRDTETCGHYMVTGANEAQQQIPEFLTGRIHSIPNLERQQSNHNVSLDTTLPAPQDPLNRLADVLVNLQNKPQTMIIRPVQTTPMTFDGKSEKFELFEDLFHTMIKMQPAMTEQMKINHFHSLLRKGALQTFRNINSTNRQTLQDVFVIFRRKYVKPESQATTKHKWHRLTSDPNTIKLPDFLEELNQVAEKAFGENAKSMIDSLLYANLPPKLKRSVNMARLENGTYEEIVAILERELELNALEESEDLPTATMASASTSNNNLLSNGINTNKDAQCSYCKATGHFYKSCPNLKKKKELEDKNGKKPQRPTYPECPTCKKTNHPAERCWKGAGAYLRPKRTRPEDKADETSGVEKSSKKSTNTETTSSGQSNSRKADSKNLFRHDSKYPTRCQCDNMSYLTHQTLLINELKTTPQECYRLSGSSRWITPAWKLNILTTVTTHTYTDAIAITMTLKLNSDPYKLSKIITLSTMTPSMAKTRTGMMSYTTSVTYSFAMKTILQQMTRMNQKSKTIHCLVPSLNFCSQTLRQRYQK